MAAPNHVDQPAAASPAAGAGQDPRDAPPRDDDDDPTQLLTQLFAGATLGPHVDAPSRSGHYRPPAAAAGASASPTATGHDLGAPPFYHHDILTKILAELVGSAGADAGAALGTRPAASAPSSRLAALRAAVAAAHASLPLDPAWIRAPPEQQQQQPVGGHAGRVARRQRFRAPAPADYLRAVQDSRDRRHRRALVHRGIRRVIFVREDCTGEQRISTMIARLTTTLTPLAVAGDAVAAASEYGAAATSSTEDAGLAEQLDKMELSFED